MKKTALALMFASSLFAMSCNSWGMAAPKGGARDTLVEENIRKNLAEDGITGMSINVSDKGVVTMNGHVKNAADHDKAINDARKVKGVNDIIDQISIQ